MEQYRAEDFDGLPDASGVPVDRCDELGCLPVDLVVLDVGVLLKIISAAVCLVSFQSRWEIPSCFPDVDFATLTRDGSGVSVVDLDACFLKDALSIYNSKQSLLSLCVNFEYLFSVPHYNQWQQSVSKRRATTLKFVLNNVQRTGSRTSPGAF